MHQHTLQSEDALTKCGQVDHTVAQTPHLELHAHLDRTVAIEITGPGAHKLAAGTEEHLAQVPLHTLHLGESELFDQDEGRYELPHLLTLWQVLQFLSKI